MNATVTPTHHRTEFVQDIETGWYIRQPQRIAFGKIPERLKVERTLETRIQANGAREVITGPFREKRRTFFSGLIPLDDPCWFIGNDYERRGEQKRNSLVLFRFSDSDRCLTVFYFNGWYIENPEKRAQYANEFARMNSVTRSN